jgi:phosphatidylglycerol:prolipoprotein diacylglycerol transferase
VPIAVIAFDFDPLLHLGDAIAVRWQTVALAAVIASVLVAAGVLAMRRGLRPDDLLTIVIGAVPGAVVGGRLGYLIAHPIAFGAGPGTILDPGVGGLELAGAVVGGIGSAALVVALLDGSIGAWAHLAALPLVVAIGAGKLTMVLGGSGQGLPSDLSWATAYLGPGPWGSLAPSLPSHPSQAYEGVGTLVWAGVLGLTLAAGAFGRRDGRPLLVAVAGWALIRAAVSTTWRDPVDLAPFPTGGWLAVALAVGALALLAAVTVRAARTGDGRAGAMSGEEPDWPDPATRPPF